MSLKLVLQLNSSQLLWGLFPHFNYSSHFSVIRRGGLIAQYHVSAKLIITLLASEELISCHSRTCPFSSCQFLP